MKSPVGTVSIPVGRAHGRAGLHRRRALRIGVVDAVVGLIAVVTLMGAGLIVAADLGHGSVGYETWDVLVFLAVFPALPVMGRLLCLRRPENPIGRLFLFAGLMIAWSALAHGYGDFALYTHPGALPAAAGVVWSEWVGWLGFAALAVGVPLFFPDGRLLDLRWTVTAALGAIGTGLEAIVLALRPGAFGDFPAKDFPGVVNPMGVPALRGTLDVLESIAGPVFLAAVLGSFATLLLRYRLGGSVERGQLAWLALTSGALICVDVIGNLATGGALHNHPALCNWGAGAARGLYGTAVPMLLYLGLPVAVAVAILRHRLYDIDRLVRRAVVYGGVLLAGTLGYVAIAAALGTAIGRRLPLGIALLGTTVAALAIRNARLSTKLAVRLEEVQDKAEELEASRARILDAADEERRRIERNIHDGAQQELVGLIAKLRLARNQVRGDAVDREAVDTALVGLAEEARMILSGLRELAQGIHPSVLTDRGLLAALETRADRASTPVIIEAGPGMGDTRFGPEVEGAAYFVAAEAMANAVKHAGAQEIRVRLEIVEAALHLEVLDDGAGFDIAATRSGSGLANLGDRVDAAGGTLLIRSVRGEGCRIEASFPLLQGVSPNRVGPLR